MILQKFATLLSFQPDEKSVAAANSALDGVKGKLLGLAAVAAPGLMLKGFWDTLTAAAQVADQNIKTARTLNVTTEAYQELAHAAGLSGVSVGELEGALGGLDAMLIKVRKGDVELARAFRQTGLSARELRKLKPDEQFERIVGALSKVDDRAKRLRLSAQLLGGSGAKFASMIEGGAAGLAAARQEAQDMGLIISKEDSERAEAFNDSLDRLAKIAKALKQQLTLGLLPALQPILNDLTAWRSADAKATRDGLQQVVISLRELIKSGHEALKTVREVTQAFGGMSRALMLLGVVAGSFLAAQYLLRLGQGAKLLTVANLKLAASTMAAAAPYLLLGGLIAFVILALEDLYTWIEGGESVIGDTFGPATTQMIEYMQQALTAVLAVVTLIALAFGAIPIAVIALIALIAAMVLQWDELGKVFEEFFDSAIKGFEALGGLISLYVTQAWDTAIGWIRETWAELLAWMSGKLRALLGPALQIVGKLGVEIPGQEALERFLAGGSTPESDAIAGAARTIAGAPQVTQQVSVQVDARGLDEAAAARAVSSGVTDAMLRDTQSRFATRATGT